MRLGDPAPDFTAWTTADEETPLHFHKWMGEQWCILFSHPADFTPVCTTELGAVARLAGDFERRGCKVIGLSTDDIKDHHLWVKDINETQRVKLNFPIIADNDAVIAKLYGMLDSPLHDRTNMNKTTGMPLTVRTVFIIDPKKMVRLMLTYPAVIGRNFDEILRALDALQLADSKQIATPANWKLGDEVLIRADMSDEDAAKKFKDIRHVKPYLRFTKLE
jgi:alkyl hydroperoxide reductase subunit AhpC